MREHTETCVKWGGYFVIVYYIVYLSLTLKSGIMPDILSLTVTPLSVYLIIIIYGVMKDENHDRIWRIT